MIYRLVVAVTAIIVCAGCAAGRGTDAGAVAANFLTAVGDGDLRTACALLASHTREQLEFSEGQSCASVLESVDLQEGDVDDTVVWGDRAQARTSAGMIFLVEMKVGWRVSAAGYVRTEAGPHDCVLAA
jgi:hypothetical protein